MTEAEIQEVREIFRRRKEIAAARSALGVEDYERYTRLNNLVTQYGFDTVLQNAQEGPL